MDEKMFEIRDDCLWIRLPEEIDHHRVKGIRRDADQLLCDNQVDQIVFDFEKTRFMDSSGIGLVMGRNEKITFLGGHSVIINASRRIEMLLRIAGVDREISMRSGEPEPAGRKTEMGEEMRYEE